MRLEELMKPLILLFAFLALGGTAFGGMKVSSKISELQYIFF